MPRRNRKGRRRPPRNEKRLKWQLWKKLARDQVMHQADYLCYYCGRKTRRRAPDTDPLQSTLDHVVPLSRGGTWKPGNLVCSCRACNEAKGDRTAAEFQQERNVG